MKKFNNGSFYFGDCNEIMDGFENSFIDLCVTSPPYDNLRDYEGYNFDFERTARNLYRLCKKGAVVVWIVQDATIKGSKTGSSFRQCLYFNEIGFRIHDVMIWEKPTFTATGSLKVRYAPVFEYMFILSKSAPKTFNPIKDRKNKSFGKIKHGTIRQKDGTTKKQSSIGKTVEEYGQRYNVWKVNTEVSNSKRCHPAQFPEKLVEDHIISWSNPGDLVFDPFGGSGTTAVAAENKQRNWILCETSEKYYNLACSRISNHVNNLGKYF